MNVNSLLSSDGDIEQLRNAIINVQTVLQDAAHDYAKAALGAANEALKAVQSASPAGAVWPHLYECQTLSEKASEALAATMQATGMLLNSEETGDATIDHMNLVAKVDSVDAVVIHAMLEGAGARFNLAVNGLPEDAKAGQRTIPMAAQSKQKKKKK